MTDTRDKVRGALLAALMVTSVFVGTIAFAGTAAAVPGVDQDPVEFTTEGDTDHIEIIFNSAPAADTSYSLEYENGTAVPGGNVPVNTALTNNATGRVVLDIPRDLSGEPTLIVSDSGETEEFDVTTTSEAIQASSSGDEQVFKGERVALISNITGATPEPDHTFDLKDGGTFILTRTTGSNSFVGVVDTGNVDELVTGEEYFTVFRATGDNISTRVRSLGLTAEREDSSLEFTSGETVFVNATASSNVAGRLVEFRLKRNGNYVDDDRIDNGDNNQTARIGGDGDVEFGYEVDREGNYTMEVVDVATDISDESRPTVVTKVSGDASFADTVVSEDRGDVARITVNLQNREEVDVNIGSEDLNYLVNLNVEDDDEDGQVVILFNTYAPNESSSFEANDDDDEVTLNRTVVGVGSPLASASYEMNITTGGVRAADEPDIDELNVGTLSLTDRATTGARTWVAPEGATLEEADDVTAYVEAGNLTRDSTIAERDLVVVEIQASGVFGALNDTNSGNATDALVQLDTDNGGTEFNWSVYESQATIAPNADGAQILNPNNLNHDIVADPSNNVLYAVIPSNSLLNADNAEVDDRFVANFTVPKSSSLTRSNERQTVTTEFRVVDRELEFDANAQLADGTDIVRVRAAPDQNITGTTSLAPGTEVSVTARATGDAPFLLSQDAIVQPDGTFAATFDFSNVSAGQNFTVDASGTYDEDPEIDGQVAAAASASVTFNDQSSSGEEVRVASATLSEGGFVTIHDSTLQDDPFGSVRGTSEYLEPGSSSGITVTLDDPITESQTLIAMPHMDTNDNEAYDFVTSDGAEDSPYTANGSAVTDEAEVTIEMATETPTPTAEPTPTPTAEPTPTPSEPTPTETEPPTPEPTTTGDGAGFGIVLALIALIGAALLAVRRND
jgi:PGF-CTERM protein/surface glycoprotein (TIGR04207 family)